MTIKFRDLKIGESFECYGDTFINYDYPKICICRKVEEDVAEEIDGIRFLIHADSEVFKIVEE